MTGSPTDHELRAALWAARSFDLRGNEPGSVDLGYRIAATQGRYPIGDLRDGEELLVRIELVGLAGAHRVPTPALRAIAELDDDSAIDMLRRKCESAFGSSRTWVGLAADKVLIGGLGEEFVVAALRADMETAGRSDLARQVQRVSLIDDALGYDVRAPTLTSGLRLIEVKSTVRPHAATFEFFISRNEVNVGRARKTEWALAACNVGASRSPEDVRIVGWCRAAALRPYLPEDSNGHWTEAFVRLPRNVLADGLPPSV